MKILAISDFHEAFDILPLLDRVITEEKPELIAFCGDAVKGSARGKEFQEAKAQDRKAEKRTDQIVQEMLKDEKTFLEFYGWLNSHGVPALIIPGNMDAPKFRYWKLMDKIRDELTNVFQIHSYPLELGGLTFAGFGGEVHETEWEDYFVCMYSAEDLAEADLASGPNAVILTHSPPIGKMVSRDGEKEKGSFVINKLINDRTPRLLICGHAHDGSGQEIIGKTVVVNPGALKNGRFALIDLDENIEVEHRTL